MIRKMYIIQYLDQSTAWFVRATVEIQAAHSKYQKGDIIKVNHQNYLVIEDFGRLRVKRFDNEINPFIPFTDQIPNK
ncbi:hypothetical protein [Sporolactobacillus terrae]|uniref:Uncharacterized protein n=1 Tax=Sporolactobacillus terrae TaxID=269673 RepID=A0ABX5Q7W5_9BACL|nr:hypothetical protein [Sporolactobacillus terrae]QAA22715.1 hypothetical protein C0674_08800 [Sporolactobacillus terrae]QAA25688.1 hypothetical protein C0679_08780 [Sporolactobacillus terrae]UAK17501.1 hypothetical protein K7399_06110 [Sporolactobacillus terrae]